ncbi:MAG: IclR family transcriptional regulator [Rhizobiaceae bacterium]|nr:IclR family transcriptional regulator [Rhizobiaceae bacterium]
MAQANAGDGTVGKALDALDQVASMGRPVRFAELLEESAYPKATLYRFLQTLTNQGMLSYDARSQTYSLGVRLVRLAHAAWRQSSLAPIARPYVEDLAREVQATVHLAQLDGGQVLYVDKQNPSNPINMYSESGKVGPGYCTGVGKAMLAFVDEATLERALTQQTYHRHTENTLCSPQELMEELREIRKTGISFDREEHEMSIICLAVPILSSQDRVLGAISVTNSTHRTSLDELKKFAPILKACAKNIADTAESWRFPEHDKLAK